MEKELLLKVAEDARILADDLAKLAEVSAWKESRKPEAGSSSQEEKTSPPEEKESSPAEVKPARESEPAKQKEEASPETSGQEAGQTAEKPVTLPEVRAVLAEKSRQGHTAEVKSLIQKHGADRLSAVDPSQYPALLKEAEVI